MKNLLAVVLASILIACTASPAHALIDLGARTQEFVLETKKLSFPEFPDAFNPCIFRWKERIFLSFRARDRLTGATNRVFITQLDQKMNPIGKLYPFTVYQDELSGDLIQDPRYLAIGDKLYVVYSNTWKLPTDTIRRVFVSEVLFDGTQFIAHNAEVFLKFDGIPDNKFEKNWCPFEYEGQLLLAYTINPHKIFLPLFGRKKCETIVSTEIEKAWEWGELRGGTQAFLVDGQYLSFFHSTLVMRSVQSDGHAMPHYFMGAYTFEKYPPFSLTQISPDIILDKSFYDPPYHQTWKPLRVVFPCGFVFDESTIWVSYGRQDHEMWIVTLNKKKLLESLVPVTPLD